MDTRQAQKTQYDGELTPVERNAPCLNCMQYWAAHHGWACTSAAYESGKGRYSQTPTDQRYCTLDMLPSADVLIFATPTEAGFFGTSSHPDQCKCGILAAACEYHRRRK